VTEPLTEPLPAPLPEPLTADMFGPDCPSPAMPIRLDAKWAWLIIRCLEGGPRRFSELRVPLPRVTPKVLSESLRAMERDGLITRTAYPENPPRVEYALTDLGRSLLAPMNAACEWGRRHLGELLDAREAYEHRAASVLRQ
jgi:DNA-binding HxlR family transcriptional regulator